jgi:hypothetical protein
MDSPTAASDFGAKQYHPRDRLRLFRTLFPVTRREAP